MDVIHVSYLARSMYQRVRVSGGNDPMRVGVSDRPMESCASLFSKCPTMVASLMGLDMSPSRNATLLIPGMVGWSKQVYACVTGILAWVIEWSISHASSLVFFERDLWN